MQTKAELRHSLMNLRMHSGIDATIGVKLSPWVIASPAAFPELLDKPIFFVSFMPVSTTLTWSQSSHPNVFVVYYADA